MTTVRQLLTKYKDRCEVIREELRFRDKVTEEELEAYWPGGSENPGSDIEAWIYCYASMVRFCDRIDSPRDKETDAVDIDNALLDTPEVVALGGGEKNVSVYPKSYSALRFIDQCDERIKWVTARLGEVKRRGTADDMELGRRAEEEIAFQHSLIIWVACSPEPGLPFPDDELPTGMPDWITSLSTTDILRIRQAFIRVNAVRILALVAMLGDHEKIDIDSRPSWSTFFAARSEQSHVSTKSLMRDRSLGSELASALLNAEAYRQAEKRAESKQEQQQAS